MAGKWTARVTVDLKDNEGWQTTRLAELSEDVSFTGAWSYKTTITVPIASEYKDVILPAGALVRGISYQVTSGDGCAVVIANALLTSVSWIPSFQAATPLGALGMVVYDTTFDTNTYTTLRVYNKTGTATDTVVEVVLFG